MSWIYCSFHGTFLNYESCARKQVFYFELGNPHKAMKEKTICQLLFYSYTQVSKNFSKKKIWFLSPKSNVFS